MREKAGSSESSKTCKIVFEHRRRGQSRKEELDNTELYQLQQRYAAARTGVEADESTLASTPRR
jgi:hypothetical protein